MRWVWVVLAMAVSGIGALGSDIGKGYAGHDQAARLVELAIHGIEKMREKIPGLAHKPPAAAAVAGRGQGGPPVPVETARAERRSAPIVVDAVGTVQAIASIQIKARIDTQIVGIHVAEGALVTEGDLLFTLDDRMLRAQVAQIEAQLMRDRAQVEQASRDAARAADLAARNVTSTVLRDTAITAMKSAEATLASNEAVRDSLLAQLSLTRISAPVSGRIGSISAKVGALVRSADPTPIATVNQIDPIYIAFAVPQPTFYELRTALAANTRPVTVQASVGGRSSIGAVAFVENTIDLTTGTVLVKARMDNGHEQLWPGAFVPVKVTLGQEDDAVVVPTIAVQVGQNGSYVFVAENGRARVVNVKVARAIGAQTIIAEGLRGGEDVVTSGQLRLVSGAPVQVRAAAATAGDAADREPRG